MNKTISIVPGQDLELRVPDDNTMLVLVRLRLQLERDPGQIAAIVSLLAPHTIGPIDSAAVDAMRQADPVCMPASDGLLWLLILHQRHGNAFVMRLVDELADLPVQPTRVLSYGRARAS